MCLRKGVARAGDGWSGDWWPRHSRTPSTCDTSTNLTVNSTGLQTPPLPKPPNLKSQPNPITGPKPNVLKCLWRKILSSQNQNHRRRVSIEVTLLPLVPRCPDCHWHWLCQLFYYCTKDDDVTTKHYDVILVLSVSLFKEGGHIAFLWWNTHFTSREGWWVRESPPEGIPTRGRYLCFKIVAWRLDMFCYTTPI